MKRVLVLTDMQFIGSGYFNISVPLFTELSKRYQVTILGLGYNGEEHNYPFGIIPVKDQADIFAMTQNLVSLPEIAPDVIIVALDIPQQMQFHPELSRHGKPYIAITPLENPPLTLTWSAKLMTMDFIFFISELGKQTALLAGLTNVDHLQIGIDSKFWRVPTPEEKKGFRRGMGIEDDELIVLTVAENQERKNLWAAMSAVRELKDRGIKVRYILVTRVESVFGWNLRDMAMSLGINKETMLMNRGMPLNNLWSLYAMADTFLLTSKAEGLGLPVMEAMSCGLPVVATDTGAIHELLEDGRGFLVSSEYTFTDVWGNSKRDMINFKSAANLIDKMRGYPNEIVSKNARAFAESRTWDIPAKQLGDKIEEMTNGKV